MERRIVLSLFNGFQRFPQKHIRLPGRLPDGCQRLPQKPKDFPTATPEQRLRRGGGRRRCGRGAGAALGGGRGAATAAARRPRWRQPPSAPAHIQLSWPLPRHGDANTPQDRRNLSTAQRAPLTGQNDLAPKHISDSRWTNYSNTYNNCGATPHLPPTP